MLVDVHLGYAQQQVHRSAPPSKNEIVVDVLNGCRRRGTPADPAVVRILVERECDRFATAPVQVFLPVRVARAVSDQLRQFSQGADVTEIPHGRDRSL